MFGKSSIFSKKVVEDEVEVDPLIKAQELAYAVVDIVGPSGVKTPGALVIYSENSETKYSDRVLELSQRNLLGRFSFNYDEENKKFNRLSIFLNYDKILRDVARGNKEPTFADMCLKLTNTSRFIYVLLHELGHYWLQEKLRNIGKLEEYMEVSKFSSMLAKREGGSLETLLSLDELGAQFYSTLKLHGVLKQLKEKNPKYLTYLD